MTPSQTVHTPPCPVVWTLPWLLCKASRCTQNFRSGYHLGWIFKARNHLHSTEDGHIFLTELLHLVHPIPSNTSILTNAVPCFTTSCLNLYQYVVDVVLHLEKHKLKTCYFDDVETTNFFLDYLNNKRFAVHKADCRTAMMLSPTVLLQYHLPTIVATFAKLVPGMMLQPMI